MVLELLGQLVGWEDAPSGLIVCDGPDGPLKGALLSDG